jgi:hypothetical protein
MHNDIDRQCNATPGEPGIRLAGRSPCSPARSRNGRSPASSGGSVQDAPIAKTSGCHASACGAGGGIGEIEQHLQKAGLAAVDELDTTCCYARQDKIWVQDPDGTPWEVFATHEDTEDAGDGGLATAATAGEGTGQTTACCQEAVRSPDVHMEATRALHSRPG